MVNLSLSTYQLINDYQSEVEKSLQQSIKNLNLLAVKIEQLPNLGVMTEVDEFALFVDEEPEDLAAEIKAELVSWPKRYLQATRDITNHMMHERISFKINNHIVPMARNVQMHQVSKWATRLTMRHH